MNNPIDNLFSMIVKTKRHAEWFFYTDAIFLDNFYQLREVHLNLVYFLNSALLQDVSSYQKLQVAVY